MSKHLTGPSPSQKVRYTNGPARVKANKLRKMAKHLRKQPNDKQTRSVLERN